MISTLINSFYHIFHRQTIYLCNNGVIFLKKRYFFFQSLACLLLLFGSLFIRAKSKNETVSVGTFGSQNARGTTLEDFNDRIYGEYFE